MMLWLMTIMRYVFDELHLERLGSIMIEYNDSIASVTEKCGWKVEGRLRKYFYRKGRYWDAIVHSITKDDYISLINNSKYWE